MAILGCPPINKVWLKDLRDQAHSLRPLVPKACRASSSCPLSLRNSTMNLVVLFKDLFKIFKIKIIEDKLLWIKATKIILTFATSILEAGTVFPELVSDNLGLYNFPNLASGCGPWSYLWLYKSWPKYQESRPKDLEGSILNYQRSLQWGKLFSLVSPSVRCNSLLVPHRGPQGLWSKCKLWYLRVTQVTALCML